MADLAEFTRETRRLSVKFSIITPSFNQLDWLKLCVLSVRDQVAASTLDPQPSTAASVCVEHIIQDAGSNGIEEFAREVGADFYRDGALVSSSSQPSPPHNDHRISIFCEADGGMYDGINRGLAKSSGEICAWLNCDEQYLENTLASVGEKFFQTPDLDVLLGDALLVDSSLRPVCYRRVMVPSQWHTRLDHLHSLSCAMFFRRSSLPVPPLDPKWKVIGDAILMDFFLRSGKNIHACRELLSSYAFTGTNLSANTAHGEHAVWLAELKWPPSFMRPLVVLQNRLRRMAHGAYRSFTVRAALFTHASGHNREDINASVSGRWPKPLE